MVASLLREKYGSKTEPGIKLPAMVAAKTPTPPMRDASTTWPLRILYIHRPTNRAIGMVQAIVNVPQELPGTSCADFVGTVNSTLLGGLATGVKRTAVVPGTLTWNFSGRIVTAP